MMLITVIERMILSASLWVLILYATSVKLVTGIINETLNQRIRREIQVTISLFIAGTPVRETQGIESVGAAPTLRTFRKLHFGGAFFLPQTGSNPAYNHNFAEFCEKKVFWSK
jgi:hypothetical protein